MLVLMRTARVMLKLFGSSMLGLGASRGRTSKRLLVRFEAITCAL